MYQLHISEKHISSWSLRAWALLKGCEIPFEEVVHLYRTDKTQQRQEWLAFLPTGKVPTLVDNGVAIWDSLAIAEYVAEDFPHIWQKIAPLGRGLDPLLPKCIQAFCPA